MKYILITGANKGIGLASVEKVLNTHSDTHIFLGSRDKDRGFAAKRDLMNKNTDIQDRVSVLQLDVTNTESIKNAFSEVEHKIKDNTLYGIVNNAGVARGSLKHILDVNVSGIHRICAAFIPLLSRPDGRVVNVTSAAGPSYVATCSQANQDLLTKNDISWTEVKAFMGLCLNVQGGANDFKSQGLGSGSHYGISKACANALTLHLAHQNPNLKINACTPGFIETDMTRPMAVYNNKTPQEMGMKPPSEGTISIMHLLFGDPPGNGRYYGSDALRSPLDRYRSPGDPPYVD
ncbi:MAG: SDR family oxidoreductase [Proteobacteria bacterium]|nr:SDR family oxidoreductase [Pseudomonadota bacterium]